MSYNSKYKGKQVEELLDKVANPDTQMQDGSGGLVPNGVIKEYIDQHPQYVEVEDATAPDNAHSPVRMRLRFINGAIYLDSSDLVSGKIELARLGKSSSRHKNLLTGEKRRITKHGWRIYNWETKRTDNSSHLLKGIRLGTPNLIKGRFYRYSIQMENQDTDDNQMTPQELMGCFGIAESDYARVKNGHKSVEIDERNPSTAAQKYALVINGVYLPFELTAAYAEGGVRYGGSPLSI